MADPKLPPIPPDEQDAIRAQVRAAMEADKVTMTDIASFCGLKYGTFSAWMVGKYAGDTSRIARETQRGLAARADAKRTRAAAPRKPPFVATPTAQDVIDRLEHAQHLQVMAAIIGGAGIGKTEALEHYRATRPNVHVVTAEPVHTSPRALLDSLATLLGIEARGLSSLRLSAAITERLRGTNALVVVDDAQHLPSQVLDQLRTYLDQAGIGVALIGNESVFARLEGGSRSAHYAPLYSRVSVRMTRPKPLARDIEMLIDAWGIEGAAERRLLGQIARKPGALRSLDHVLRTAHMVAAAEGAGAIDERLIRTAWRTHSGLNDLEQKEAA